MSLPGQQAVHRGDPDGARARTAAGAESSAGQPNSFRFPLSIPGEVTLGAQGWAISAERAERLDWPGGPGPARSANVAVALESSSLPLAIRSRRPGDRFRPLGLGARQEAAGLPGGPENPAGNAGFPAARGRSRRQNCVGRGGVGGRGFSGHGAVTSRDTLESKAVRRPRLNSTLKSLLFWMVLVVVGVLIWTFSTIADGEIRDDDGVLDVPHAPQGEANGDRRGRR